MDKKQIAVIICLFIVFLSAISVVSASDTVTNKTVSTAGEDINTISIANNQEDLLGDPIGSFTDLDDRIDSTPEGVTQYLEGNYTYNAGDSGLSEGITIDKSITLDGQGYTINALNQASIFNIGANCHVILQNINFINAHGTNGSAIKLDSSSTLNIINCNFTNNTATSSGGAIYVAKSSSLTSNLVISGSNFINNTASSGGAIYMNGNSTEVSTIEDSTFIGCSAKGDGGAIYISANNVVLKNAIFEDNLAGDDGGAIYWEGNNGRIYNITCTNNRGTSADKPGGDTSSTRGGTMIITGSNITISDSEFKQSSAYMDTGKDYSKVDGGALFVTGNDVTIDNVDFEGCNATNNGGALYVIGNRTHIVGCDFTDCIGRDGAALFVNGDNCTLYDSTFTDNVAYDDGGAIYWEGDNGYMYNITCINNKGISGYNPLDSDYSNSKGGTICLTGSNVTIDESLFTQSSAKSDGGALFITGNGVKVLHSDFSNSISTASNGGAVYIIGNDTHIFDCTFDDCQVDVTADHRGGAIYVAGNDANINKSSFTNTKAVVGGAICIEGNGTVVDESTFSSNDAVSNIGGTGGAINIEGADAVIKNSEFSHGTAVNYGGAIAVWGPNAVLTNNTFDNAKTTRYNGGAVFVNGKNATISLSNFTQCKALGDTYARGGAVDVQGDDAKILNCNFDDCDARLGGVIYVSGADAHIDASTFTDSEANEGGAIYVDGVNTIISNSNFTDITAADYGGSIYVAGANANISAGNFIRSTVTNRNGGAIFVAGENATIEKSNFTSAKALNTKNKALGGAIYIEGSNAVVNESNFDDCQASQGGGAIYSYGNDAKIEDSTFNSSTAKYGGAIYLTSWGSSVTRSNITGSIATENGGGIYVAQGSIEISESNFNDCIAKGTSATNGGGAIYINGPDTHVTSSNFTNNSVPGSSARGGAIFINGERTVIEDSQFDSNTANQGGVIFIEGKDAVIDSSIFFNSSSRSAGGSIYVKGDDATIQFSSFDNITAGSDGGAIYVDGEGTDILNSTFYNCTVGKNRGGAIYIDDLGTTVAYSNFTLSKATDGGAIYIRGVNTTISYCNLDKNVATSAGAIKVYGDDTIISNCNFTYNNATVGSGGALDIGGSNASVYYSWFDHNMAILDGGAINWLGGHGDDSIIGSTFTNNICYDVSKGGGAIYWTQGNVIAAGGLIKDSIFINNTAAGRHGGAIDWFHALDSKIDNCLFVNNTAKCDGGALYTGDQGGNSKNLTITNTQFYNNTAGLYGGALANQMANSYIFNNIFDGNVAKAGGGSILMKEGPAKNCIIDHCYIYNSHVGNVSGGYGEGGGSILLGVKGDSNITISNCAIQNSTIENGPGGAIAIFGTQCSLINVSIEDASTENDDGGAIYWKGSYGNFNNVTIVNASSHSVDDTKSSNGGAVHVSGWYCNLNDVKIYTSSANNDETCTKTNNGGAIYVSGSGDVLTNIIIDDSSATNVKMNANGGAIFWEGYGGKLINATISNTLATGNGGAIYWKGTSPALIANISIEYSQTRVTDSDNTADGGAIYSTTVDVLNNVTITDASAYKNTGDVHGGAIYMLNGKTLNNVTVTGSRASTDDGTSYGGAAYFKRTYGSTNVYVYDSSFTENNADLGGGLYFEKITARIYDTSFTGNVANQDGGALYSQNEDELIYTSNFTKNSAKNGGAILSQNGQIQTSDSTFDANTAEKKGGAIYYNYTNKAGTSQILRTDLINNVAFQGSAIYGTQFNKLSLKDSVLLDNQANSNKFIEKYVGVDEEGNNYTSAIFLGFDNLLNAIWQENTYALSCSNVTYWGVDGETVANSAPTQSDREVNINVTVEMYDENGVQLKTEDLVTDSNGKVKYIFDAEDGKTYYFAYVHQSDSYYTYLRDTLSNSSLVKIYVLNPIFYSQNQTIRIELTDGAWGNLNGTVTVTFNDTDHTTFTIDVVNGTGVKYNISGIPIGVYNATASFAGDLNHTGDTDWTVFEVLPYVDLHITKDVNVTGNYVNVSDVIEYTITVRNHGPSKAYGVNVTEVLSSYLNLTRSKATKGEYNQTGGYWYIGELDVDDFEKLTIVAEIIHMGPITNTVWVTGLGNDTNISNNVASARNLTAVPILDLRITKEVNVTADVIGVLDVIRFNITVFNDGPCNATGVIVEELLDSHLSIISNESSAGVYKAGTWNIGNLTKGANATLTIVAQVVYSGNISNVVRVSGFENETDYTNNVAAIKNITAIANVDLKINKKVNVSGIVNVTDVVEFTIAVTNDGPCNATGVYVSETLSPHLKMLSNKTTIGKYDGSTWIIGNLNKGETHNLTIIAEVISAGTISNVVSIFGSDNDTNKSNNNDSIENITSVDIVDLEINKTVDVTTNVVNVSDIITFTITLRNHGPCDATNVTVTEKLSPHLRMVDYSTWASSYDVDEGIWYIGNLAKNDWRQLVIKAEVISAGTISNVVVVTSNENDTNKSNNKDEIPNITAIDIVDLQIKKEVNTSSNVINVTDSIKYTITVFNAGPSNATNVNVSEVLSPHLKLTKSETEYGYYNVTEGIWYIDELKNQSTAVLTIEALVVSNGTIANVVIVNSTENDTDLSNNRAEITNITSVYIVDLQIKKEVNVTSTELEITDKLRFNITVYNAGPCNATNVYACEPLSDILLWTTTFISEGTTFDGYTWFIGNLTSGSTVTLIIDADIAYTGVIENAVNVTCSEIDINITNNEDNITPINVSAHIDVAVNKTVNVTTGVVNVGDLVEFFITATNNGPCNASGVYVYEDLDLTHLSYESHEATQGTTYDGASTWIIGRLNANENATLKIVARVIAPGNFSNYVQIYGYGDDKNLSNNNYTIPNITAIPVVDLEINKTVNVTTGVVEFGDRILFTITVRNNGPSDATGVNVTEKLSSHLKMVDYDAQGTTYDVDAGVWYIGNLAKDDWRQLVIVAEVISAGNISNVVNVTSTENDTNKSNNNDSIPNITAIPIVDLQIKKEANVTGNVINVTDSIKYTITVFNDGPCNATNVNVSEVLSPHLKLTNNVTAHGYYNVTEGIWYIGNLENKSTAVLTIEALVVSNGTIANVVIVNSTEKDTNTSNNRAEISNITAVTIFDLQITKVVNVTSTDIDVTDKIKFNITVYNAGPCNATGVYVYEPLSDNLVPFNITTSKGKYSDNVWYIGNLTVGANATMTIEASLAYGGIIVNKVNVTGDGVDYNLSNNEAEVRLNATAHVDLGILKFYTGNKYVNVSDVVKFDIIAFNLGPNNASGVYVLEALDFTHLGRDYNYTTSDGSVYDGHTWNIGNLNKGGSVFLTIFARVIAPGNFSNYVEIHGYDNDTDPSNNHYNISNITALPIVDLSITKEVDVTNDTVYYGDIIEFTITVRNNGPCDATNVNVTEVLDSNLKMVNNYTWGSYYNVTEGVWYIGDLAKGDWRQLVIQAEVTGLGNITNAVSVTSTENDTNKSNNNDSISNITVIPIVDLRIIKTVDVNTTEVNVTDTIKFTLTVFNDGPCNATNVYVREPLSDCLELIGYEGRGVYKDRYTWVIGNMTAGENATITITAKVVYSGIIENSVEVLSDTTDIDPTNNVDEITPLIAVTKVDLAINKTVNVTTGVVNVGDLVEFFITATNNGPCNASGVYVLEALDLDHLTAYSYEASEGTTYDGYTWYIGYLNAGSNATLKVVARVSEAGNFSNYVEIFGYDEDTNTSNNNDTIDNITAIPVVDLDITKEVNVGTEVLVGQTVVFTVTVRNNGPSDATNVNVSEVLSPHLKMVDYMTWDSYYDVDAGVWYIGELSRYDWRQLIIVTEVVSVGNISNAVVVTSSENDTNESNNNDTIPNITAKPAVDLQINKDINSTSRYFDVYDYIEYTITVYNDGPNNATNVNVTEELNSYLRFINSTTDFGHYNVTEGVWHIGNLENGSTANLTIKAQIIRDGIVISNVVVVTSSENDTNPYNNRDELIIAAKPVVDLRITKEVNATSVSVTDLIEFVVTVYNDGPCNATGVFVIESLSDKLLIISNVTSQGNYDGFTWNIDNITQGNNVTLTIVAQVIYAGNISNAVTAYAYQNETNYTNNNASVENITAVNNVDLQITKKTNVSGVVNVTDRIEFTITVTNIGPCNATGVYVSEILNSHLKLISNKTSIGEYDGATWVIGNLTKGEVHNLTIVAEVISAGNISNLVSITSGDNDTNMSNNEAEIENITAVNIVDLNITKIVDVSGVVAIGDSVVFTVTVRNNGPCDATNVNVTEVLSPHLRLVDYHTWDSDYDVDAGVWYIGNLTKDDWRQLIIETEVVSVGNITNVVCVTSSENDTNKSNNNASIPNITAVDIVDLTITKQVDVDDVVFVGQNIVFTITVRNNGPCDATNVNVTEVLSPHLKMIGYSTWASDYDVDTGVWYIGNLTKGDWRQLVIVAEVISAGNITNTVNVTSSENDTNKSNNNASIPNITAVDIVDLTITKEVDVDDVVFVGENVVFTITVRNKGPCDATNVNVTEVLSPHLRLVDYHTWDSDYDVDAGVWYIGNLTKNDWRQLVIVAEVISAGNITNAVTVTSSENDTNKSNNNASIPNITAKPAVDLYITKTSNVSGVVNVTDRIEFDIVVYNAGPSNATNVNVSEILSPNLKLINNITQSGYYDVDAGVWYIGDLVNNTRAYLSIIAQVISNGTISNAVNVTSSENDTDPSNNKDEIDNITAVNIVDVSVNKTVSTTSAKVGDEITYVITVENYGPCDATDVVVNENLSGNVVLIKFNATIGYYNITENVWYIGKLTNGSVQTLTLTVEIRHDGIIENSVVIKSHENDTNITNNNYTSDNVTAEKCPTPIDLITENITYGEDEPLIVVLPDDVTGVVNITVGDRNYTDVPINKGIVELPVTDLAGGDYNVTVVYGGDEKYLPNSTSGIFNVAKVVPIITIEVVDIWVGEVEAVNVTVNAPGVVFVTVNNVTVEISLENGVVTTGLLAASGKIDYKGNATWNIWGLPVGPYPAFALYPGNENYTSVNTSDLFHVRDLPSTVVVTADDIHVGEDAIINIEVGPEGVTGSVTVNVDGENYTLPISDGKATLTVPDLKAGEKEVTVWYNGTVLYRPSQNTTTFDVLKIEPPIDIDAPEIYVGEDGIITVSVPDDATGTITIEIDGKRYTETIEDGVAIFVVPGLKAGEHDIVAYYSGDDKYLPNNTTGVVKVNPIEEPDDNITKHNGGISLSDYPTGNPIIVLLIILLAIGSGQLKRFKRK